jgi:hypothetical protein
MPYDADRVVVELIAKVDNFDGKVTQSAKSFEANADRVTKSAERVEKGQIKMSAAEFKAAGGMDGLADSFKRASAAGDNFSGTANKVEAGAKKTERSLRATQQATRNLGYQISDIGTQVSMGTSPFIILAQQGPQVANAVAGAGGKLARFASFLSTGWGAALLGAITILGVFISKHKDSSESVGDLVEKLKEHAAKTRLSEEADRIWSQTLDGLIERQHKLNEELGKRLTVQEATDNADLRQAQADLDKLKKDLEDEKKRKADLERQLAIANRPQVGIGQGAAAGGQSVTAANLGKQIAESTIQIANLEKAVTEAQGRITKGQIIVGEAAGKAIADLTAKADLFGQKYLAALRNIELGNPALAAMSDQLSAAREEMTKAAKDAAAFGVDFVPATSNIEILNKRLKSGQLDVKAYAVEVRKLAAALEAQAEAAKEAAKINPREQFKQAVIGAEGTGPNRMGSSAAGFGQFMPSTWLSYFNRLFPDKAALSDAAKLGFRNIRAIADAVIDKATDDYVAVLKTAGQKITAANLYTVHLLGSKDASKFFAAGAGAQTSSFLSKDVLAGNPFLKGTVASAAAAIAKRIGDSSGAVSRGAAALVQTIEQEKERLRQFINEKASLEADILDARRDFGISAEEAATIEHLAVEAARQKYEDNVKARENEGKYTAEEAQQLIDINNERAKLRDQLVERRKQQELFRQQEARNENALVVQTGLFDAQKDLLQSEEGLARTAAQRRRIEDRLIDIQFEEERMRLQAQISLADRLKAEAERTKSAQDLAAAERAEADAAIARQRLQDLPREQANAHTGNARGNASPMQDFFNSIPDTAERIDEALEAVAAHGLATFNDALANAIVNFTSLGDVGRAVLQALATDLIKLALQQIELHTIGAALGAAAIGTTTAAAAAAGAAWAGPAALASLATLGANAGPAAAALASTVSLATLLGAPKAGGGRIFGPGGDTSDTILTPTSPNEFVIKAKSARAIGYDNLAYMNQHGRLPGGGIRPSNDVIRRGGEGGFSSSDLAQLRGIVETAIRAMPEVNLYPTVDSGDVIARGVKTGHGSRAIIAHVGDNASHYKAQINRPGS